MHATIFIISVHLCRTVGSVNYRLDRPPPLRLPTSKLLVVVLHSMKLRLC